jgi:hypothetical protein
MSDTNSTKRKPDYAAYSLHMTSEGTRWTRIGVGFTYKNGGIGLLYDAIPHGRCGLSPFQRRPLARPSVRSFLSQVPPSASARRSRPPPHVTQILQGSPAPSTSPDKTMFVAYFGRTHLRKFVRTWLTGPAGPKPLRGWAEDRSGQGAPLPAVVCAAATRHLDADPVGDLLGPFIDCGLQGLSNGLSRDVDDGTRQSSE